MRNDSPSETVVNVLSNQARSQLFTRGGGHFFQYRLQGVPQVHVGLYILNRFQGRHKSTQALYFRRLQGGATSSCGAIYSK